MIKILSNCKEPIEAIIFYNKLCCQGLVGNNLTFIFILKAISRGLDIIIGGNVHSLVIKLGYGLYLYVCNALIHMYAMCGDMGLARKMFDEMSERDLVSWNSLICGYSHNKKFEEVVQLFDAMLFKNIKADSVTMVKVLLAYNYLGELDKYESVIKYITDNGVEIDVYLGNTLIHTYGQIGSVKLARYVFDQMAEKNAVSWNSMIMAYAKNGDLVQARIFFDNMPKRDVISWTSMITGLSQAKQYSDALGIFQEMMRAKIKPDEIVATSVLSACAHLGKLNLGEKVHIYIKEHNVKTDIYIGNSLIDMYCKCGSVEKALEMFEEMRERDSVSWTSIISGLAVNGKANYALKLFSIMLSQHFQPTHGTFVGVLLACAHAGLVDKGLDFFTSMEKDYGLVPEMKHYGCVVDLLSRSGDLNRAYEFIKLMPIDPDVTLWRILLSGCKLHGDVALGEIAKIKVLELDPCNSGNYVLSSLTYAGADRWNEATKMRELIDDDNVKKPIGWSSLVLDNTPRQLN